MRWGVNGSCEIMYDLILRGGHLIDPAQNIDAVHDIAFSGGKVAAVSPHLEDPANEVRDVAGLIVAPGLIDLHTHVYWGDQRFRLFHQVITGPTFRSDAFSSSGT